MGELIINQVFGDELNRIERFLQELGLGFDRDIEYTLGAYIKGELVGTCSFSGRVIKCFGVDKSHMGEGIAAKLITQLSNAMFDRGIKENLVFTKNLNRSIFEGLGFSEIIHTQEVTLFEGGFTDIKNYVKAMFVNSGLGGGPRAGLVMNCNPFTLGHRYLIECAAKENAEVVVFVVEQDSSIFPFNIRKELIKAGVSDLKNVHVLSGGSYIISQSTFPTYFLKKEDQQLQAYTSIDAGIFGKYIAPGFNINIRYVGEEPLDRVTAVYNEALFKTLPGYGIEVKCIERLSKHNNIISASSVRKLLQREEISSLKEYLPQTTLEFLNSDRGKEIIKKIRKEGV